MVREYGVNDCLLSFFNTAIRATVKSDELPNPVPDLISAKLANSIFGLLFQYIFKASLKIGCTISEGLMNVSVLLYLIMLLSIKYGSLAYIEIYCFIAEPIT